jgi:hypothetical protein
MEQSMMNLQYAGQVDNKNAIQIIRPVASLDSAQTINSQEKIVIPLATQ